MRATECARTLQRWGCSSCRVTSCGSVPIWTDALPSRWSSLRQRSPNVGMPSPQTTTGESVLSAGLGDVELRMLHQHDETTARRKWESRVKHVDHDRLIFKLNDQNGATEADLFAFDALPLEHKLVFAAKEHPGVRCCRRIHCPRGSEFILASREPFGANRSFNVTEYINDRFGSVKW